MLAGLLSHGAFEGDVYRAGGKWYFKTRKAWASIPVEYRWVFDTSAESYPEPGPALLYGAVGSDSLSVVMQHGKAVGWFRGDQPATARKVAGLGALKRRGCTMCPRCGGTGYIQPYKHVEGGVCFCCKGSGCEPPGGCQTGGSIGPSFIKKERLKANSWTLSARGNAEAIEHIKYYLRVTFNPYEFESQEDLEDARWYQIATNLVVLMRADDKTLYQRAVKRAFQYAEQRKATKRLKLYLDSALAEAGRNWLVPHELRKNFGTVSGVYEAPKNLRFTDDFRD